MYKKDTSAAACMIQLTFVYILYSLYIICVYENIQRPYQFASCIGFVQCVHYLHIFCIFIIISLSLSYQCGLCIQSIYKFSALYNFDIHFVQFLYNFFGKGSQQMLSLVQWVLLENYSYLISSQLHNQCRCVVQFHPFGL